MVIHEDSDGIVCIGQAAHAWVSGQMARCWGNESFAAPEPLEEVALGAEQHDVGMAEWDARPLLNLATGRPMSFMEMPVETHVALWTAAPYKVLSQSPYAALLVSMHGHALYANRDDPAAIAFRQAQEAFQRDVLERTGADPQRARRDQRLVWALDYLSIAPLAGWLPGSVQAPEAQINVSKDQEGAIAVDPWPFAAPSLTLGYWGRRVTSTAATQEELDELLAAAPWEQVTLTWRPGS